jgi:hypothetical protein
MRAYLKYNQLNFSQILIPNQLVVDIIFAFYLCNLLIIIIFTPVLQVLILSRLSFFFFFKNQFKASEF